MAARMLRNNGNTEVGPDWNDNMIPPGGMAIVDDASEWVTDAVAGGTCELDPTMGRHYQPPAGPGDSIRPVP
jgi:hypothetical protein